MKNLDNRVLNQELTDDLKMNHSYYKMVEALWEENDLDTINASEIEEKRVDFLYAEAQAFYEIIDKHRRLLNENIINATDIALTEYKMLKFE